MTQKPGSDVKESLDQYRETADRILMEEKFSNLEQERYCIVTEDYGFLWNIRGGVFGVINEEFFGSKEFYREHSDLEDDALENWYHKWIDSVLEVEDEEFIMVAGGSAKEYVEKNTELYDEKSGYQLRRKDDTLFRMKEIEAYLEDN